MVYVHGEKFWTAQRQLETLFIYVAVSQFLVPNQIFLRKKHSVAKKWNWENCLHVLSLPNSGNSYDFGSGPSPRSDWQKKLLTMGWMQLGHVCVYPCMSQTLLATNERSFNMLLRVWMLEEKHWTAQRQIEKANWKAFYTCGSLAAFLWNDTPLQRSGAGRIVCVF